MVSIDKIIENIKPCLERLEADRLHYKKQRAKFWSIAAVIMSIGCIAGAIFVTSNFPLGIIITAIVVIVILIIMWNVMISGSNRNYVADYKQRVIPEIVKQFDMSLSYSATQGVSIEDYKASELLKRPDRFATEDLITGSYGNTRVKFGEVHAKEKRTSTDSEGRTSTRYVTIFKGVYFMADFHKHFHGRTFVLPDLAESTFGRFGRKLQKLGGKRGTKLIQMDDPEFEQEFAIYSTDEVECRYILSNSMMRNILEMKERLGRKDIKIAFKGSIMYLSIPYDGNDYLEPHLSRNATNTDQLRMFINQIGTCLQIVDDLNLNTRIWSKK